ncbi:MAG: hypothetical protein AAF750_15990 [Planctomycetota bacterium]
MDGTQKKSDWVYVLIDRLVLVICLPFYGVVLLFVFLASLIPESDARRLRRLRRKFRTGAELTSWLAPDLRRDVLVVDNSELAAGIVTVRMRTCCVYTAAKRSLGPPPFGDAMRVKVDVIWRRTIGPAVGESV